MAASSAPHMGPFYCCLVTVAAALQEPRVGAEERGLVRRLNKRHRGGGLCFKAFIQWPKLGRERVRDCAFEEKLVPACSGRISCSLASTNVPATFDLRGWGEQVSVVVRPDVVRKCLLCSWAWDGWKDLRGCNRSLGCVPGCVGTK